MNESSDMGIQVSIVIPLLNEVESLPELQRQLVEALEGLGKTWEILYCDDGSTDGSLDILRAFAEADTRVRVISFRRNYGQTAGLSAGFEHARGEVVIPMDADLQNDPADIALLLAKLDEGYDLVSGWRKDRKDGFFGVVLPSRMGNMLIRRVTGVALHDFGCTMKAYRREILQDVALYGEMQQILRDEGGLLVPVFANHLQAHSDRVATPGRIGSLWAMDNARFAERWWRA